MCVVKMLKITAARFIVNRRICNIRCLSQDRSINLGNDTKNEKYKSISECYAGKSLFVTGGTGFVGKVLIERLLHTCSDIEKIYILIREKKGQSIEKRLEQMLDIPLFEKLKEANPSALNKLEAIGGDVSKKELAIKPEDEQKIIDNVSMVFHTAANVKFNDSLQNMMNDNYEGTKRVVKLSKKIKKLQTFLYFSTVFCNSDKLVIDEVIYPRMYDEKELYNTIDTYGDTPKQIEHILAGQPNAYTLSKSLCENFLQDEHKPLPTVIVRPAIVTPMYGEPCPGWVDSWVVTTALYSDIARGITKVFYTENNIIGDIIPVDYVANLAIVAAAKGNKTDNILIYNSCTSTANPITWKMGADLYVEESRKYNNDGMVAKKAFISNSPIVVNFLTFTLQTVPAFLADIWLRLKGEEPKHLKIQKRSLLLRDIIKSVSLSQLHVKCDKTLELISTMDEKDKILFPCDPRTIVWRKYMRVFYKGVINFMLKNK